MRLILYTQYYRARTPERQAELDHCLRSNLQHPQLDQVVVLREPDAPELPGEARMPVQVIEEAERLTYARWMRLLQQERDAIGILINADIALGDGFEQMQQVLNTPDSVMALSRYNPQGAGQPAKLNRFPHWTQDTWALRSDAPISDSLLYASSFPIGYPGCDNRIAYVLWSHGLAVKNPCYAVSTLHHQAGEGRAYDKNADRLYGGVSYVHPTLALQEASELEHTIWTRSRERCPGVLVNQQAVEQGVHQLLAKDGELAQHFLHQQKSTGQAWQYPPLGCNQSAHGSALPLAELIQPPGWCLPVGADQRIQGLQLRLPRHVGPGWQLQLHGQRQGQDNWQNLALDGTTQLAGSGERTFVEASALQEPWQQLRLQLLAPDQITAAPEGWLELVVFAEAPQPIAKAKPQARPEPAAASPSAGKPLKLQLSGRRLASTKELSWDGWSEVHSYNSRFLLKQKGNALAFVDRFWPTAVLFEDGGQAEWTAESLQEAFLWGFAGPVLEWKANQFSTEKLYLEQLNFWQYPCRTEQDAFERHQRMQTPYWDAEGVHLYVGMPWATWIDKKTFPDTLLEAYRSRVKAMQAVLGLPLQVHSVCQHIRWKEHPHRFEQAGINQLWIAHKEKGWDTEGQLRLHSWPLYAVNVLDPERREGLELLPVEKKTVFASFKGAHMKHYPSDIRLRLRELAHLEGYEIEITDLWHFNKVVYNYQIANKNTCKEAIEKDEIRIYNRLLSQSLFSLCPRGAGPNTLRLWESLAIGSIPVIISNNWEAPRIELPSTDSIDWDRFCVFAKEESIQDIHKSLIQIDLATARRMQDLCLCAHKSASLKLCFNGILGQDTKRDTTEMRPARADSATIMQSSPKITAKLSILVIGSSVSIQKTGYIPLLQRLGAERYNTDIQFLNASLGGCSTEASLAYLKADLFYNASSFNANIAIIEKTPNERHLHFSKLSEEQQELHEKQVFDNTIELCIWCLEREIMPVIVCSYFKASPNASWSAEEKSGYLRRCYEKVARILGITLIDIHSVFSREARPDSLLLDDVHLNSAGSHYMAEIIGERLLSESNVVSNKSSDLCAEGLVAPRNLKILYKAQQHTFKTRLLSAPYDIIEPGDKEGILIRLRHKTILGGIFYVSDQASLGIQITPDDNRERSTTITTFDHMSFLPRVTYKKISNIVATKSIRLSQFHADIDIKKAIDAFHDSKTFNPEDDWAVNKYLRPLRERLNGDLLPCEKIIAIFGSQLE